MQVTLALSFLTIHVMTAYCQGVIASDKHFNSLRQAVILGKTTKDEFLHYTRAILDPPAVLAGRLVAYVDRKEMHRGEGVGGTESNYDHFRHNLTVRGLTELTRCPEMWEALKIGNEISVRSIDSTCHIAQHSLSSGLTYRRGALGYRIFAIVPEIYDEGPGSEPTARLQAFVSTDSPVDITNARTIMNDLRALTRVKEIFMSLRGDRLFFDHPSVPVALLVAQLAGKFFLSKAEYLRRPEMYCSVWSKEDVHCRVKH